MKCRVDGCDRAEWMMREICDRHWHMLPADLQQRIRIALKNWRSAPASSRADWRATIAGLQVQAFEIIAQKEEVENAANQIGLFRTHMASVSGTVAALRTIPLRELHAQLSKSAESIQRSDPDGYAARRQKIELDLALLEILGDASDKLHEAIKTFTPAPNAFAAESSEAFE